MSLLQWKPEYSVGIDSMDDEHREMIGLINDAYGKLAADADEDQLEECLGDIFNTISMHFALEERIMQSSKYRDYQAHKNDHEKLLDEFRDLMDDFLADPVSGSRKLEASLANWFAGHFSSYDARLHGQLKF